MRNKKMQLALYYSSSLLSTLMLSLAFLLPRPPADVAGVTFADDIGFAIAILENASMMP